MTNATEGSDVTVVDVRSLVPVERHRKIFELVEQLAPGASFVLVNDHDPKPLYYQLEAEHPKQFSWTYIDRGQEAWRIEIGKLATAAYVIPCAACRARPPACAVPGVRPGGRVS